MNVIKGYIQVKGSKTGISGLVVQVFDLSSDISGRISLAPHLNEGTLGQPMGSTVTRNRRGYGEGGEFAISYEDAAFLIRSAERTRPDLLLLVLAPEEPGRTIGDRILYQADVRRGASPQEFSSIQLDGKDLQKREIALPELQDRAAGDPKAVTLKTATELKRRREIRKQISELAKAEAAEARALEQKIETQLRDRVL